MKTKTLNLKAKQKKKATRKSSTQGLLLKDMIESLEFDHVNNNITSENFPEQEIRGEVKIFHFDRFISSEDVIKEMKQEGYEPANLYELLEYAKIGIVRIC